ncbi:MAG TPA: hypothetical protein VNK47_04485 [Candidatus Dormibacteraeota bacterium]|nr:hypothetical protein [Candidatus Dormibacteraeota bacterium]
MDENGADFGGVGSGIEKFGFADGGVVAAEEGFALLQPPQATMVLAPELPAVSATK